MLVSPLFVVVLLVLVQVVLRIITTPALLRLQLLFVVLLQ